MDPGSLELQIFVSLIVILGAAFVALVCDYLKGNNETLREHNLELRVRKEEQDRNRPVEAVEWLQHLLGATQRNPVRLGNPVRFGNTRPQRKEGPPRQAVAREATAAAPMAAAVGGDAVAAPPVQAAAVPRPQVYPRQAPVPAVPAAPALPIVAPVHVAQAVPPVTVEPEPAVAALAPLSVSAETEPAPARSSRSAESRARRQDRPSSAPGLLESLPVPAWLKKEQEEKAAARAVRDKEAAAPFEPNPKPVMPPEPRRQDTALQSAPAPMSNDTFWTYKGLLDKVVAAATHKPAEVDAPVEKPVSAPKPAPVTAIQMPPVSVEPAPEPVRIVEPVAGPMAERQTEVAVQEALVQEQQVEVQKVEVQEIVTVQVSGSGLEHSAISTVAVDVPVLPISEPATTTVLREPASASPLLYETYDEWAAAQKSQLAGTPFEGNTAHSQRVAATAVYATAEEKSDETPEVPVDPVAPLTELVPTLMLPPAPAIPALLVPDGFRDKAVLTQLLQSTDVLTGVVVAVGINEYVHQTEKLGHTAMADLMRSVEGMIAGLLRAGIDFGCRSSEDEFILIFPNETGAAAQRRLTTISERLWNFQLRSISSFSVLFSWGAVEVQAETLADAAAGASERMYQTKRTRKTVTLDSQRRKLAVNL